MFTDRTFGLAYRAEHPGGKDVNFPKSLLPLQVPDTRKRIFPRENHALELFCQEIKIETNF